MPAVSRSNPLCRSALCQASSPGTSLALQRVSVVGEPAAIGAKLPPFSTSPGFLAMPHNRRGFTLIELLIVVVIIGILAALAIPRYQSTRGKAYFAGMRSDLRNLTTAEEAFFYDHSGYTTTMDSLKFTASNKNAVAITEATLSGWSGTSQNAESWPHFCALFVGTASAVAPATVPGVVACQ